MTLPAHSRYSMRMKALLLILTLASPALATPAFDATPPRKADADRTSKNGKLATDFDGVKAVVTYGKPQVKGRKIWGELVPYGEVWRAGADEATVIAFEKDVLVEGKKLPAGQYGLFVIPTATEWTIIFNREPNQWGAYKYDMKKDALRVSVKAKTADNAEELRYEKEGGTLVLHFEKLAVPVKITKA